MKRHNDRLYNMILLALFSAIIVVMSFTPLGYLKIAILEPTLLMVPVAIGAILLGPVAGAILGGVFGITSFIQCFGMSTLGVALLAINPVFTFIVCIVPRVIEGVVCALMVKVLSKTPKLVNYSVSAFACALANTVFFMGFLMLFFGGSDYILEMQGGRGFFEFIAWFVGIQGVVEIALTTVLAPAVALPLSTVLTKSRAKK